MPIGCPIEYIPSKVKKQYYSEITKDKYANTGFNNKKRRKDHISEKNHEFYKFLFRRHNSHYITDGIFCSFNCCLAFIKDNWYNNLYTVIPEFYIE